MTVRDRYDPGAKVAPDKLARLRGIVREGTQRECERYTIYEAQRAVRAGTAGPFALDLVVTFERERAIT
jgi:hypothetical protein